MPPAGSFLLAIVRRNLLQRDLVAARCAVQSQLTLVRAFFRLVLFGVMTAFFAIVFSPHNIISFSDFISALHYESVS